MPDQVDAAGLLASFSRFTQHTRLLRLTMPAGADLLAECVRGEEAISRGYTFKIDAREPSLSRRPHRRPAEQIGIKIDQRLRIRGVDFEMHCA
jgi:uncharacterized protein involved in type VI secretion and phage assembly